jgi:MFS family permease
MNAAERKAVVSLASLYALRMMGLFMVLPVLSLYAADMTAATPALIGLAIGSYGLTQALLQIPFGVLSDRYGRKKLIIIGLLLFALGSVVAGLADNVYTLIAGRFLQGSGAIASVLMALLADVTRPEQRSKAMASVGASIGMAFALALVFGPMLSSRLGLNGLFFLVAVLALGGIAIVRFWVPAEPARVQGGMPSFLDAYRLGMENRNLLRLNAGVFVLHCILTAVFLVVPAALVEQSQIAVADHGMLYLGVFLVSFLVMIPMMILGERKGKMHIVMPGAVLVILLSQLFLANGLLLVGIFVFFAAFNLLEATMPSQLSRQVDANTRGAAMGGFASSQFLGAFAGGWLGGILLGQFGAAAVFYACMLLALLWFFIIRGLQLVR